MSHSSHLLQCVHAGCKIQGRTPATSPSGCPAPWLNRRAPPSTYYVPSALSTGASKLLCEVRQPRIGTFGEPGSMWQREGVTCMDSGVRLCSLSLPRPGKMPHLQAPIPRWLPLASSYGAADTLVQHLLTAGPSSTPARMTTRALRGETPNRAMLTPTTQPGVTL